MLITKYIAPLVNEFMPLDSKKLVNLQKKIKFSFKLRKLSVEAKKRAIP